MAGLFGDIELPAALTLSYAVGRAGGSVFEAQLEGLRQSSWALLTDEGVSVRPTPELLAAGVAQGQIDRDLAATWATYSGVNGKVFDALVDIANVGPGSSYAFELWRRGIIGEPGFRRAVKRLGWEQEWIDDAVNLKEIRLSPEALAVMIQRSVVPNPGILPNQPPTANSDVPPMPVVDLDVFAEAAAHGVDEDRLKAMARIIGLPASPDLAARMHFRKIINEEAFNQAIKEGNTRGEWAPFLLEGFRDIPTSHDGIEGRLRHWLTDAEMYEQTARHGMSQKDTDLLFKITGRPVSFHQVFIGERRGGTYDGDTSAIDAGFLKSLEESNIRPEWYNLAWAQRHSYPSAFVIRALLTGGALSADDGYDLFLKIGWPKPLARQVADFYGKASTTPADPHVTKAENQLWTALHSSYVKDRTDDATATSTLGIIGVDSAAVPQVLAKWQAERELQRAGLSASQIKKAYQEATFTQPEAVARLVELGWSAADAAVYLPE